MHDGIHPGIGSVKKIIMYPASIHEVSYNRKAVSFSHALVGHAREKVLYKR